MIAERDPARPARSVAAVRWGLGIAMLALLLVAGLALSIGRDRQARVIAELESLGAFVETQPRRPDWLREPALDYLARDLDPVVRIRYSRSRATRRDIDRLLAAVESLPDVQILRLERTPLTDADLERLARLPNLDALDLSGTAITDAGLVFLRRLPRLTWLVLDNTAVTDAGVEHLRGCVGLEMVSLERTRVTDAALGVLKSLPRLDRIYLAGTRVTASGLSEWHRARPRVRVRSR